MFKRKLKALDYIYWDKVNGNDKQHFRKLVLWLEDQKIRHYTIQDRAGLNKIKGDEWDKAFEKYLLDLECPITTNNLDKLEWLVGLAVRLEFEDNVEKYHKKKIKSKDNITEPTVMSANPLDNLNFKSDEFKNGTNSIAKLLKIAQHPNHLITIDACSKYVTKRLNETAIKNPESVIVKGTPFPIMKEGMSFGMGDKVLDNFAKALDLLYIQDLRNLQTTINEVIVEVQGITADPKTNTKAQKIGI